MKPYHIEVDRVFINITVHASMVTKIEDSREPVRGILGTVQGFGPHDYWISIIVDAGFGRETEITIPVTADVIKQLYDSPASRFYDKNRIPSSWMAL